MRRSLALIATLAWLSACGAEPDPCPSGTWDHDGDPATECVAWSDCEPGEYVAEFGSATQDRRCAGCPSGTVSDALGHPATCVTWTTCEAGSYVAEEGDATRDRECASCPAGTYTSGPNQSRCVSHDACAPGTVQTAPASGATPPVCEPCAPGEHCPGGELPAVPCEDGRWDHDADPSTACVARTVCVAGSYVANDGSATSDRSCASCESGTYSSGENAASCAEWSSCAAGQYVSGAPSATADRACEVCPEGTYTTGPNQSACVEAGACAPGTVETAPGTPTAPPVCDPCVAGEHCPGDAAPATACGPSTWDHDADPATACAPRTDCAPGQHVEDDGSATTDRTCAPCPAGTYSATMNAPSCAPWTECTPGQYVELAGTAATDRTCSACAAGTYSDEANASSCMPWTECAPGQYVQLAGSLASDRTCAACAAGTYSSATNALACAAWTECAPGRHVEVDGTAASDRTCSACAAGTYSDEPNAPSCTPWTTCAPGTVEWAPGTDTTDRICLAVLWTRQFGTSRWEDGYSATVDGSGNVIVAGTTGGTLPGQTSAGYTDASVRKYDADGTLLWTRQFGTTIYDWAFAVSTDGSGNVIVAGATDGALPGQTPSAYGDAFVRKYDGAGTLLWTRQFGTAGGEHASSVSVDGSGNVIVAGYTGGAFHGQTNAGYFDGFVRKYDESGNVLWTRQFGSALADDARSADVDGAGNVIVAGRTLDVLPGQTSAGGNDVFVRKYDSAGGLVWTRQFGSVFDDAAVSVTADGSGNVIVAGGTSGALAGQASTGDDDVFVRTYDAAGGLVWTRQFGSSSDDVTSAVGMDGSGNVIVAGFTDGVLPGQTSAGGDDVFVRMYDSAGTEIWTRQFGTASRDYAHSVSADGHGNVVIAGTTDGTFPGQTSAGSSDAFVMKLLP